MYASIVWRNTSQYQCNRDGVSSKCHLPKAFVYLHGERVRVVVFFSSRRRHTRYWRDWSSDVCSSDLGHGAGGTPSAAAGVGPVPIPHGPEPLEPADRRGAGAGCVRRAGHDGGAAERLGRPGPASAAGGRGGDRRGLRRGRAQGPTGSRRPKGRLGRRRKLKAPPGRGMLEKDKPPVLGLIQRGGQVVLRMLANVQQKTIQPVIGATVAQGARVHTDAYKAYARLPAWGYRHKTVCHSRGGYARDEDGDGFCEIHVNTMEGFWSLLRSWLRPHRGISQDKLPLYLGFFQVVHNVRRRGKALLGALVAALVT